MGRLEEASKDKLYTVAMVDPDVPSRKNPRAAQWLHWIITNVKGELLISGEDFGGRRSDTICRTIATKELWPSSICLVGLATAKNCQYGITKEQGTRRYFKDF